MMQRASNIADKVKGGSACSKAVKEMQNYDASFELTDLDYEVKELGRELFCNFLSGNVEYMDKVSGGTAHAWFIAMIELRKKEGWAHKYEEVLDLRNVTFADGRIVEGRPTFKYSFDVEEI
jgi:hypothetical protein